MRYACYIRVSTDRLEQATSLDNQRILFENYVKIHGGEIYKIYQDVETGTKSDRKGIIDLLGDAERHEFDVLLIKDWSRFSRNVSYSFILKDKFDELDIPIINVTTGTNVIKEDTVLFAVNSAMAQQEAEKISQRTKMSFIAKAHNGEFKGSRPPYGYYVKEKKLYIRDDETPDIVRLIFNMYIQGSGCERIARHLTVNKVPTPSQLIDWKRAGEIWHGSTVDTILRNRHYAGDLAQCKSTTINVTSKRRKYHSKNDYIIVEDAHEPIIPKELFNEVQNDLNKRHKEKQNANYHLFSNILICEDCGRKLHYKANSKGYVCGGFNKHGSELCSRHFIKEEILEKILLDDIKKIVSKINSSEIINKVKNSLYSNKVHLENNIKKLDEKVNKLNAEKINTLRLFTKNHISKSQFELIESEIIKDLNELEIKKSNLLKSLDDNAIDEIMKDLNNLSSDLSKIVKLDRRILNQLVEKIVIKNDGTPRIYYKFSALIKYLKELGFSNQLRNTFNVHCMREHINRLNFFTSIAIFI